MAPFRRCSLALFSLGYGYARGELASGSGHCPVALELAGARDLREFPVSRIYPSPTTPSLRMRAARHALLVGWTLAAASTASKAGAGASAERSILILVDAAEYDEATALLDHARSLPPPRSPLYESIEAIGSLSQRQRQRALSNCQRAHRVIVASEYARSRDWWLVVFARPMSAWSMMRRWRKCRAIRQSVVQRVEPCRYSTTSCFLRSDDRLCVPG